jgi:hypothetical protein
MDRIAKQDEHCVDGKDNWTVHYSTSEDTRINPSDYKEVIQIIKNGAILGQTTWHKDKDGKDKNPPYVEGLQDVPATAKKVKNKKSR